MHEVPRLTYYCRCSFSFSMSYPDALTCYNASRLTRCHRALVSNSCHFFRRPLPIPLATYAIGEGADNPFDIRHVTAIPEVATRSRALAGDADPAAQCVWYQRSWIVAIIHEIRGPTRPTNGGDCPAGGSPILSPPDFRVGLLAPDSVDLADYRGGMCLHAAAYSADVW